MALIVGPAFTSGWISSEMKRARDEVEASAGWTFAPDYSSALASVAANAGSLVAGRSVEFDDAHYALRHSARYTGLIAMLGLREALDIIGDGLDSGARYPADFWGWRDV